MIDELLVKNLGVVEDACLRPGPGLTVITGETGAGKTILVGALRLLAGAEARPELVGPYGDESLVEARLVAKEEEIILSRRVPREGRSRAYLNGGLASVRTLDETLSAEVEIVGQHDQLSLTRPAELLALVDGALDETGRRVLEEEHTVRASHRQLIAIRDQLGGDQRALTRELDLVRFQANEIERAGFNPGDDEELERKAQRLRNASNLIELLAQTTDEMDGLAERWGTVTDLVRRAARVDPSLDDLVARITLAGETHTDLGREARHELEAIEVDENELEIVESRLTLVGELKRKYGSDLEEVRAFGKEAGRRAEELERLLQEAGSIDNRLGEIDSTLAELSPQLQAHRKETADRLVVLAHEHLLDLGFDDPVIRFEVAPTKVELLFASDSRLTAGPVEKVASGGELSRLILSLRLAAGATEHRVVVFDEIDAGIGGVTALAMGRKLAALARERQVLCVTHLPQVAAFAEVHYRLEREGDRAVLEEVKSTERQTELARMLAGLPDSERGREAAAELLALAEEARSA